MQHILLLLAIFITGVKSSGYYFVTAPNVIRFEHNETVVVSVFELTNASVSVWLQYKKDVFSLKTVTVPNDINPINTTLRVSENDLFHPDFEIDKPRRIDICSKWNDNTQCREVLLSYRTGYLIVQTDKPIYSPLQKVNVRTLALDESLKAVTDWQVCMDFVSPSNITLARKTVTESNTGFYSNQFTLPDYPELGIWTARAFYRGQFETESRSLFEVKEYVLPTFGVTIDINVPYILNDTTDILVTVKASYVYGKPVRGNARLSLYLKEENGTKEYILDIKKKLLEHNEDEKVGVTEFKIGVDLIRKSPSLKGPAFRYYDGKRLEVIAIVYESVTGKEEASSNENTIFTLKPYIFKFTRSKLYFRPRMEYFLKIDMLFANGQPAKDKRIKVHMYKNDVQNKIEEKTTDKRGQAVSTLTTTSDTKSIKFMAETSDTRFHSEYIFVKAYSGKNQIQAENIITDNVMYLRASTNIQGSAYTGMLFMVVSRGKIVYQKFENSSNTVSEAFIEQLQEKVSPSARFVVFYVDKENNEIVADSVKFDVEKKCRGDGLKIKTEPKVLPGSTEKMKVTGSPFMWVGFNVMDKALFLLNDKNVLRKEKMFEVLESHDLGCGEGSGKSNADVFKKSGLTILTNAKVEANDLVRNLDGCNEKKRRKRDDEDCYYGANNECCHLGKIYANESYHQNNEKRIDAYTVCYAKARQLAIDKTFHAKCILAYFVTCKQSLEDLLSVTGDIMSKSIDDETEYISDLERLSSYGVKPTPRTNFWESWLFDIEQLDRDGELSKSIGFPHSVTEWMIQVVGITQDKGMCIADGISVNAFKPFFIQLDLPYEAVRMETFDVKATIFNYKNLYGKSNKTVNVYLHGEENLCSNSKPGMASPRVQIRMSPNSAQTLNFPVIPLKQGIFSVKVSAFSLEGGLPEYDVIEKSLIVVNEGIQEEMTINVCLNRNSQSDDCRNHDRVINDVQRDEERVLEIDLTLPKDSIPQTGVATAFFQSNVMDTIVRTMIEGVDKLLRAVSGCCEQKLSALAKTVYAMNYLKQTNQMTREFVRTGTDHIKNGINKEIAEHRHARGFYFCNKKTKISGTWLTAFVAKMFCQAMRIVPVEFNKTDELHITLNWLTQNVSANGSFHDESPVMYRQTTDEDDESLTAFVLITLLECDFKSDQINKTVQLATKRLESLPERYLKANPFILAISTYALALADSTSKSKLKQYLQDIQRKNGEDIYWGLNDHSTADAFTVETTAYALHAMLSFNELGTSKYIARWLMSKANSDGSFISTQDTVVALQALSKYTILMYTPDVDIKLNLSANHWHGANLTLTKESSSVQKIVRKLPVEKGDNKLIIKVSGTGTGIMAIDLRYNRPATEEESCPFEISDIEVDEREDFAIDQNLAKDFNCDICGCPGDKEQGDVYNVEFNKSTIVSSSNHELERRRRETDSKEVSRKTCVRFSVSSKNEIKKYGMSIVNFGLQTGVDVVKEDIKKLFKSEANIERYEMPSHGRGFIVFYLHEITSNKTNFIFRLQDNLTSGKFTRQSARVHVYDYYNKDQHCSKFYDIVPKRGDRKRYWCNPNQRECQCIQSVCVEPVEEKLIDLAQKRNLKKEELPANMLKNYTCNPEKANYAAIVKIESLVHEQDNGMKVAHGTVMKVINPGHSSHSEGGEMTFFWDEFCENPSLELGTNYTIIGKNGFSMGPEYRYPLKDSALVIRDATDGTLSKILKNYKKSMEKGCEV